MTSVAADGKEREMMCLPLLYVFGWLFTIDVSRVNEEARDSVVRYKRECYEALCNHFIGSVRQFKEDKQLEISLLEELNEYTALRDDTNKKISATRRKLDKLREKWMKGDTLFD